MRTISTLAIAIAVLLSWPSAEATQTKSTLNTNLCLAGDHSPPMISGNNVIVAECNNTVSRTWQSN